MRNLKRIFGCFIFLFLGIGIVSVFAQPAVDNTHRMQSVTLSQGVNMVTLPAPSSFQLSRNVKAAHFKILLDLGDEYDFGSTNFEVSAAFTIDAYRPNNTVFANVFNNVPLNLVIHNKRPEEAYFNDFTSFAKANGDFDFDKFQISVSSITVTDPSNTTHANLLNQIASRVRLRAIYDIEYGFNVNSTTYVPVITAVATPVVNSKVVTFTWSNGGFEFPNYEFQLLKLHNNNTGTSAIPQVITADINWSKALRIETQSAGTSLRLTIAEDYGLYVWRVRPIGNYFEGNAANDLNWGQWSSNPGNQTNVALDGTVTNIGGWPQANENPYFYFDDKDSRIVYRGPGDHPNLPSNSLETTNGSNNIYSRIFTEGNRISENISYATGLNQVKQEQKYIPSKDTLIATQKILDFMGRPSLTTMPVPVQGQLDGYKQNFVETEAGQRYKAESYDDGTTNYNNPSRVDQTGNPFSYYSDNNPDTKIPNAEGYPFQRSLYFDDGTGRTKEESGVGKTHMINDGTPTPQEGGGRTVRTMYSTASETELIRLFGDEAPDNESVLKTISIDQNNTASVTYTSKEGKVIATCLSFQEQDNTDVFDKLDNEPNSTDKFDVDDKVTRNVRSENGFISTKRLAILQTTPFVMDYKVKCLTIQAMCDNITLDCKYKLQVIIHNLDNPAGDYVFNEIDLTGRCQSAVNDYIIVQSSEFVAPGFTGQLAPGNYVIEKKLVPGDVDVVVEQAQDRVDKQIKPISGLIISKLKDIDCEKELYEFYTFLGDMACYVNNGGNSSTCNPANMAEISGALAFPFVLTPQHKITISPNVLNPTRVTIESPCCSISVPIEWIPPFRCPETIEVVDVVGNDNIASVNTDFFNSPQNTEFFPDFEGYAISVLKDCFAGNAAAASAAFYQNMQGWNPGDLNWMVHHMLTDKYITDNTAELTTSTCSSPGTVQPGSQDIDECSDPVDNSGTTCDPTTILDKNGNAFCACTQYKCSDLARCWTNQVAMMKKKVCDHYDFAGGAPYNVSQSVDEDPETERNDNNSGKNTHDDSFDENGEGNAILKWLVERKISKKMRDMTDPGCTQCMDDLTYKYHIVEEFLNCAGYKFAKILTDVDVPGNSNKPLTPDEQSGYDYTVPNANNGITFTADVSNTAQQRPYQPKLGWGKQVFDLNHDLIITPAESLATKFPRIMDPVFAFKYFEYQVSTDRNLEVLNCFVDPNDCRDGSGNPIPCCYDAGTQTKGNFCVTVSEYPTATNNRLTDPNYPGIVNPDGTKDIVKEFCGIGRIVCPYTHENWSAGQRLTFYMQVKNVKRNQTFNDPSGVTLNNCDETYINQQMTSMQSGCSTTCDSRRNEFKDVLLKMLNDKCYVVGGCKQSATDNIVLESDVEKMVDAMVAQCKDQCVITTYKCEQDLFCRELEKEITFLGPSMSDQIKIEFGVTEAPVTSFNNSCTSSVWQNYNCGTANIDYCQITKWKQAKEWTVEVDLPSKCEGQVGVKNFDCVQNANMCTGVTSGNTAATPFPVGTPPDVLDVSKFNTQGQTTEATKLEIQGN